MMWGSFFSARAGEMAKVNGKLNGDKYECSKRLETSLELPSPSGSTTINLQPELQWVGLNQSVFMFYNDLVKVQT